MRISLQQFMHLVGLDSVFPSRTQEEDLPFPLGQKSRHKILGIINLDGLVKSQKSCRSRGGGSPELLDLTGFPLSRE